MTNQPAPPSVSTASSAAAIALGFITAPPLLGSCFAEIIAGPRSQLAGTMIGLVMGVAIACLLLTIHRDIADQAMINWRWRLLRWCGLVGFGLNAGLAVRMVNPSWPLAVMVAGLGWFGAGILASLNQGAVPDRHYAA